jgi:hypothetical protein
VLVKHLLPVGQVPTLEYIFELQEGPCIVQIMLIVIFILVVIVAVVV